MLATIERLSFNDIKVLIRKYMKHGKIPQGTTYTQKHTFTPPFTSMLWWCLCVHGCALDTIPDSHWAFPWSDLPVQTSAAPPAGPSSSLSCCNTRFGPSHAQRRSPHPLLRGLAGRGAPGGQGVGRRGPPVVRVLTRTVRLRARSLCGSSAGGLRASWVGGTCGAERGAWEGSGRDGRQRSR